MSIAEKAQRVGGAVWLLRAPVIHFVLIGTLLFGLQRWQALEDTPPVEQEPDRNIVINAARLAQMRTDWVVNTFRLPTAQEQENLLRQHIDEELLYREALSLGLDRHSPVVRNRLIQNMRFLGDYDDTAHGDEQSLYTQALELGLDRSDQVIRRHLVQAMRLVATHSATIVPPTEAELRDYLQVHMKDFRQPERVRIHHVYLSKDRRGQAVHKQAKKLLAQLRGNNISGEAARDYGDSFSLGRAFGPADHRKIARIFGTELADAIMKLDPGQWSEPLRSQYGYHLVWVSKRIPQTERPFAEVKSKLMHRWLAQKKAERMRTYLDGLRELYHVEIRRAGVKPEGAG